MLAAAENASHTTGNWQKSARTTAAAGDLYNVYYLCFTVFAVKLHADKKQSSKALKPFIILWCTPYPPKKEKKRNKKHFQVYKK